MPFGILWLRPIAILYMLPALIFYLLGYRFFMVNAPYRIGHLAAEVDWLLKSRAMGEFRDIKPIILRKRNKSANATLLDLWGRKLPVISNPVLYLLLQPLIRFPALQIGSRDAVVALENAAHYPLILNKWGERAPIFEITDDLSKRGTDALLALGVPEGAWFVCVHARDGAFSPGDESWHSFRNSDISTYDLAIDEIIRRGGWCIRMGEPVAASLAPRPGLIDYPVSPFKSDWMDIFLCSRARFFLGNTSGLAIVSTIAGVPCALAHMAPYGASLGMHRRDLSIPKLLQRRETGEVLSFREIFSSEAANFRYGNKYNETGLTPIENTPEQVRDLAIEMLDTLEGTLRRTAKDEERQKAYRDLMTPRHYTYHAGSRIGRSFLAENEHLL
jgi:putative glycosyltransferase (TIGR04372 family)